jgi:alpha-ketoglutarate-dependent taurine dioxygenase
VASESDVSFRVPGGGFGPVEVVGFRPSDASDPALGERLRDALSTHALICIRLDAPLDDDEALAVATAVGPLKDNVAPTRDGSMMRYAESGQQIVDAGFVLTDELRAELGDLQFGGLDDQRPGLFESFHTDDSFTAEPAAVTMLHARELPARGGATVFLDMRAAYALLDPATRERLRGIYAVHAYNNHGAFPPRRASEGPCEALVEVAHPVVRLHPVTKVPALYFDLDRAVNVAGMPDAEGRALLKSLQDHAELHAPTYAHAWQPHDVVMWDNGSVQHKASGDFTVGEPRRFWRYSIAGGAPIPAW